MKIKMYEFTKNDQEEKFNDSQIEIEEEIMATRFLQLRNKEFG